MQYYAERESTDLRGRKKTFSNKEDAVKFYLDTHGTDVLAVIEISDSGTEAVYTRSNDGRSPIFDHI